MKSKKPEYLVGAVRHEDGSRDMSKAAIWHPEHEKKEERLLLTNEQCRDALQIMQSDRMSAKQRRLKFLVKKIGIEQDRLLQEVRQFAKEKIRESEKGNLHHYHRTSMENFERILAEGSLLSRSKLQEKYPDREIPKWSASDDIMMTRDQFDHDGRLIMPGISEHGVGASGEGVIFVFSQEIMEADDYDSIYQFPTMSEIAINQYCEALLVEDDKSRDHVQMMLEDRGLQIPVLLKSEWSDDLVRS